MVISPILSHQPTIETSHSDPNESQHDGTAQGSLGRLGFAADRDVRVFAPDGRAGLARSHGVS